MGLWYVSNYLGVFDDSLIARLLKGMLVYWMLVDDCFSPNCMCAHGRIQFQLAVCKYCNHGSIYRYNIMDNELVTMAACNLTWL